MENAKPYTALLLFRFFLIFLPQTGYLHPDEFIQSVEISASDVLGVRSSPSPWEVTSDRPIRSASILHLFYNLPLMFFKFVLVDGFSWYVDAYFVTIVSRLSMAILSLANDALVALLARELGLDLFRTLFLYASSFVTIVHGTRTLSNSLESSLFSLTLVCLLFGLDALASGRQSLAKALAGAAGAATALGVMNRPTFAAFVAAPYAYALLKCRHNFNLCATAAAAFAAAFVSLVLYDTLAYDAAFAARLGAVGFDELLTLNGAYDLVTDFVRSAVVTPFNFVRYNSQSANLALHGTHPRWLHLVNLAVILGPAVPAFCWHAWGTFRSLGNPQQQQLQQKHHQLTRLCIISCFLPLLVLSAFPHQELRFLTPLLPLATVAVASQLRVGRTSLLWFALPWLAYNAIGVLTLGFLHQGGVFPMTAHVGELIRAQQSQQHQCHRVLYIGTYPPPQHALLLPPSSCTRVEDLMGNVTGLNARAAELRAERAASVYAVFSSVYADKVRAAFAKSRYSLKYAAKVYGHLSTESLFAGEQRLLTRERLFQSAPSDLSRALVEALSIMVFHFGS